MRSVSELRLRFKGHSMGKTIHLFHISFYTGVIKNINILIKTHLVQLKVQY